MTKNPNNLSDACLQDIVEHLKTDPHPLWRDVKQRHPDIPEREFYRLVGKARKMPTTEAGSASVDKGGSSDAGGSPPQVRAKPGSVQYVDVMASLRDLMLDSEMLRQTASGLPAADGTTRISDPALFGQSIRMRREVVKTMIDCYREAVSLDRLRKIFEIIIDQIRKESPEMQVSVIKRLREVEKNQGIMFGS